MARVRKNMKKTNAGNTAEAAKKIATPVAAAVEETVAEAVETVEEVKEVSAEAAESVETAEAEAIAEVKETEEVKKRGRKPGVKNKEKAPVKAVEKTENIYVEAAGEQYKTEDVAAKVRAAWAAEGHRAGAIKSLNIYINMDERKAYYVINEKNTGSIEL